MSLWYEATWFRHRRIYGCRFGITLSQKNSFVVWFSFLDCNPKYPPRSQYPSLSAYAVSPAAIICIETAHSDDITALNVVTLVTKVVSAWTIPSRILANKAEKDGKTSNQFHYTRQANGLRTPLQVSANLLTLITALIHYQSVKFQLRRFHHIVSN